MILHRNIVSGELGGGGWQIDARTKVQEPDVIAPRPDRGTGTDRMKQLHFRG